MERFSCSNAISYYLVRGPRFRSLLQNDCTSALILTDKLISKKYREDPHKAVNVVDSQTHNQFLSSLMLASIAKTTAVTIGILKYFRAVQRVRFLLNALVFIAPVSK